MEVGVGGVWLFGFLFVYLVVFVDWIDFCVSVMILLFDIV